MRQTQAILRLGRGLGALALLSACLATEPLEAPSAPPVRPAAPETPPVEVTEPSQASRDLATYYQREQSELLAQGLLRGDGGGADTPFSATELTRNFVRIALFDEYRETAAGTLEAEATVSSLRRWEQPINMSVEFGSSVPLAQRDRDTTSVAAYASRLQRLTGVPIRQTDTRANFHVLVLNENDRLGYDDRLRELLPGISEASVRAFLNPSRSTYCLAIAVSVENSPTYARAVVLIRAEHPDLLRLACIHEELAQAMGLANDSPSARPSIFNDDEEFGLLTRHDELLLQMLYDPSLSPGMSAAQAAPIAREIAQQLVTGPV